MRKQSLPQENSEAVISLSRVLELLSELRARVERLEKETFPDGLDNQSCSLPLPPKLRKGRRPKLNIGILLQRRVRLTAWLETNWPRLSIALRRAQKSGDTSEAIAALIAAEKEKFSSPYHSAFYESPKQFEDDLRAFFKSGRFHGNPRNLAAAMAGRPELSWKRSFDICSAHSYKEGYKLQAHWDYMRRNFPDRLRELEAVQTPLDVENVLARSRTDDPLYLHLKKNPDKVKEWLEAGKPETVVARRS